MNNELVKYHEGTVPSEQLNEKIAEAWDGLLNDPKAREQISQRLGIDIQTVNAGKAPFLAEQSGSGATGAEIVIYLAGPIVSGFLAEAGAEGFRVLVRLWKDYIQDSVAEPGSEALGPEIDK